MLTCAVALATYNGEPYLEELLDSLVFQSHVPDEIVIADDCSTDTTVQLVESYIAEHRDSASMKLIRNEANKGFAHVR